MRFEQLEHRKLLAGDVMAAVIGGNLVVHGGDANDHVSVYQVAGETFKVLGQDGTLINGASSVSLSGVTNIQIVMGNGNDYVIVRNSSIAGSVSYVMGNGVDDVKLQSCVVGGNVTATVGQGASEVYIGLSTATAHGPTYDTQVGGNVIVTTGDGGDYVKINSVRAASMMVTTGAGNDYVSLHNSAADSFFASLGAGDDKLSTNAGYGNNQIARFAADGGPGYDTFQPALSNQFGSVTLTGFERVLSTY